MVDQNSHFDLYIRYICMVLSHRERDKMYKINIG